jgi:hypothetical protein
MLRSPIDPVIQSVLDLFTAELAAVKFPDMDRAVLESAAEVVKRNAATVTQAETALATARTALEDSLEILLQRAMRAIAYARVYADQSPELRSKVDAIPLARPRALRKHVLRGRLRHRRHARPPPPLVEERDPALLAHRGRPARAHLMAPAASVR